MVESAAAPQRLSLHPTPPKKMNQEIRFRGLALTPDPRAQENGALQLSANVELHNTALRPSVLQYTEQIAVTNGYKLVYVHETTAYRHFITEYNGSLYWDNNQSSIHSFSDIKQITNVGNTLVILDASGIHYVQWKDNSYHYLGQKPPFLNIQFSLREDTDYTSTRNDTEFTVSASDEILIREEGQESGEIGRMVNESVRTEVTEQVMAQINKLLSENTESGYFHAPFFIRYAYRLYDGTLIMHSAPVLMAMQMSQQVGTHILRASTMGKSVIYRIYMLRAKLQYKLLNGTSIGEWSDIVKSIDFFITPPDINIDYSQQIKRRDLTQYGGATVVNGTFLTGTGDRFTPGSTGFIIPTDPKADYNTRFKSVGNYFLLHTVNIANISSQITDTFSDVQFNASILANITTQRQMTDDYRSHYSIKPEGMFVYNHRLNAYAPTEKLVFPFDLLAMLQHCTSGGIPVQYTAAYVVIATEAGSKVVQSGGGSAYVSNWLISQWIAFPDSRATHIVLRSQNGLLHDFPLKQHPQLELAYFDSSESAVRIINSLDELGTVNNSVPNPNKLFTSAADNPFFFPLLGGRNTIGTGSIIGIAANTRALSAGTQIGKFPVIVFASDGIWLLDVSAEGTYTSVHNISREVCSNPKSICQLDQQVIFATKGGLSTIVEQDVTSLTESLNGEFIPLPAALTDYFIDDENDPQEVIADNAIIRKLLAFDTPPVQFLQTAQAIYDSASQRVLFIPQNATGENVVALVLSTADGSWSTFLVPNLVSFVNAYPHAFIQFADYKIAALDKPYPYNGSNPPYTPTLFLTRPLAFGDAMYALNDLAHNYRHAPTSTRPVSSPAVPSRAGVKPLLFIFGSNDLSSWHYVGRTNQPHVFYLPSHSFRHFKLAVFAVMKPGDEYISLSLNIREKFPKL